MVLQVGDVLRHAELDGVARVLVSLESRSSTNRAASMAVPARAANELVGRAVGANAREVLLLIAGSL